VILTSGTGCGNNTSALSWPSGATRGCGSAPRLGFGSEGLPRGRSCPLGQWQRLSAGQGGQGWGRWLLVERTLSEPVELAYYVVFRPVGTRWAIEESLETAAGKVGLDHYEVRRRTR
jgi:hypothetical protein